MILNILFLLDKIFRQLSFFYFLIRSDILIHTWDSDDYYLGLRLDVFISRLRKYLSSDDNIKIHNLHGIGFRFNTAIQKN